jgi:hypothetical protein
MFGFGPSLNTVFRSRWKAVVWAMGIMLTAYCTVPFADAARKHETHKVAKVQPKSPWSY